MRYTNSFLTSSNVSVVLYEVIAMFFIYSFIGWIWECLYVWVKDGKLYNRGFLTGPIIPIYGLGGIGIVIGLGDFRNNIVLLFVSGVFLCTLLEYITAVICEKCFHTKLWDYTDMKFNFRGRICLAASVMWGVMSVLLINFIQPIIENKLMSIPRDIRLIFSSSALTLLIVDIVASIISMYNLKDKIREFMDIDSKLREIDAIRRLEDKAQERSRAKYAAMQEQAEASQERVEAETLARREKIQKLHDAILNAKKVGFRQKRLLKAMPQLKFTGDGEQKFVHEIRNYIKRIKDKKTK